VIKRNKDAGTGPAGKRAKVSGWKEAALKAPAAPRGMSAALLKAAPAAPKSTDAASSKAALSKAAPSHSKSMPWDGAAPKTGAPPKAGAPTKAATQKKCSDAVCAEG
jgi:hypothetical protein